MQISIKQINTINREHDHYRHVQLYRVGDYFYCLVRKLNHLTDNIVKSDFFFF